MHKCLIHRMNVCVFMAPVDPYKPGLVCRRLSCCSAPAAAQSHSPVWPLQSDSVSGSKWLWRRAENRTGVRGKAAGPFLSFKILLQVVVNW